jgi:hypothetical protein
LNTSTSKVVDFAGKILRIYSLPNGLVAVASSSKPIPTSFPRPWQKEMPPPPEKCVFETPENQRLQQSYSAFSLRRAGNERSQIPSAELGNKTRIGL